MLGDSVPKRSSCRSEGPPQIRITLHVERSTTMFFEAESDGSHPSDTLADDGEARHDFSGRSLGSVSVGHHVEPRVKLKVPKEEFPRPLRDIDVVRRTHTILDVVLESRIDDSWFHAVHIIECKTARRSGERLTKVHSNLKARSFMARNIVKYVECCSTKRRTAVGFLKNPKLDNARLLRGIYCIDLACGTNE